MPNCIINEGMRGVEAQPHKVWSVRSRIFSTVTHQHITDGSTVWSVSNSLHLSITSLRVRKRRDNRSRFDPHQTSSTGNRSTFHMDGVG